MGQRSKLRQQLASAWSEALRAYGERLINSEHGLQVHFCIALAKLFASGPKRLIYVEPKVRFSATCRRHPDLVIAGRDQIIAVVELKYTPRGAPSLDKDLDTLSLFCRSAKSVTLLNERYRGPVEAKPYPVASDAVLCWAGIYCADEKLVLPSKEIKQMGNRFHRLDALTSHHSNPLAAANPDA